MESGGEKRFWVVAGAIALSGLAAFCLLAFAMLLSSGVQSDWPPLSYLFRIFVFTVEQALLSTVLSVVPAVPVALARMVEDEIEDHADAVVVQRLHRLGKFGDTARHQARIKRHEGDGIIAPSIRETEARQMPLVDPGSDRHQFDGIDAEPFQMIEYGRMAKRCDGAALQFRDVRMQHGEGADRHLVDQPALAQQRLARRHRPVSGHDRLRHQRGGILALQPEAGIVAEGPVELFCVRIDQKLCRIEPQAAIGIIDAVGAKAVTGAFAHAVDIDFEAAVPGLLHRVTREVVRAILVEEAEIDAGGVGRIDGEPRPRFVKRHTQRIAAHALLPPADLSPNS